MVQRYRMDASVRPMPSLTHVWLQLQISDNTSTIRGKNWAFGINPNAFIESVESVIEIESWVDGNSERATAYTKTFTSVEPMATDTVVVHRHNQQQQQPQQQ